MDQSSFRYCNLKCQYCSPDGKKIISDSELTLLDLYEVQKSTCKFLRDLIQPSIFRISGNGEIAILKNLVNLLFDRSLNVILTNGLCWNENLMNVLKEAKHNVVIHFSLDGHLFEMNSLRVMHTTQHETILNNLIGFLVKGFPVEVHSVLTVRNARLFPAFLDYLKALRDKTNSKIVAVPAPVRPFHVIDNDELFPESEDIEILLKSLLGRYDNYYDILPPKAYLEALIDFCSGRERNIGCFIPDMSLFIGTNNVINWCNCGSDRNYGLLKDGAFEKRHVMPYSYPDKNCSCCFTHFDIINLFILGHITEDDIQRVPSLSTKEVLRGLNEYRRKYNREQF